MISVLMAAMAMVSAAPEDVTYRLVCTDPVGNVSSGTGVYVSPDLLLTAAHVASGRSCHIGGVPAPTVYVDGANDVAMVRSETKVASWARISCRKARRGMVVSATGYPGMALWSVRRMFVALGKDVESGNFGGLARFVGEASPGMSGSGMVYKGRVIGVLTAGNNREAYARMLHTTGLCK